MERFLVLHVTNIPTPYRLPQYRAIQASLSAAQCDLAVYFIGRGKRRREWTIGEEEFRDIRTIPTEAGASVLARYAGIARAIDRERPSAVVLAWGMDLAALLVLRRCLRRRIPCLVYTGETISAARRRKGSAVRAIFRRPFFRLADGWIAYGRAAEEYVLSHGVPAERVRTAINVVDTSFFMDEVAALRASGIDEESRSRFRTAENGSYRCHFLYVGELLDWKRVDLLLDAFASTGRKDFALHIVGSGPMEAALRHKTIALGVGSQVLFHGYVQRAQLPSWYALADVFVFPSPDDVFGLVLVEASAAGLPIVASNMSGGTRDVVMDNINGFAIDPFDASAFARALVRLADDQDLRLRMGSASSQHARTNLTLELSARGYREAITRTLHDHH